jgi:hypothetical protein
LASTTQKFVIGGVVLVGVLLLISERSDQGPIVGTDTSGTRSCTVTVTADLSMRSRAEADAPVVGTLNKGVAVLVDREVSNGYRQLGPGLWAAQEFLQPAAGSDCG